MTPPSSPVSSGLPTAASSTASHSTYPHLIRKRDGHEEPFLLSKITASIHAALIAGGVTEKRHETRAVSQVLSRISHRFTAEDVPTVGDIQAVIELAFIDLNLSHVAKRYLTTQLDGDTQHHHEPVYGHGITCERYFTKPGLHPYDEIVWELRDARITNEKGEVIFEQRDVEMPITWSQTATNIVVQKYFAGTAGTPLRERSVRELVTRVAHTIADWGRVGGYFDTPEDAEIFEMELTAILVTQRAAFNSPVWFNVGLSDRKQQCSACFINSVSDDMHSILTLAVTEGMLFKYGSGTGSNLSSLRSSKEFLANSVNKSSGPVSFMKAYDSVAGVVKSGGKTRRAAKMVILNIDHPDILEFIRCKASEERKAWVLMDAGYDGSIVGEAYQSVFFQNANNSVRVSDEFMKADAADGPWETRAVVNGAVVDRYRARDLMHEIAEAAYQCGDPGMQYDTTINHWHTTKNTGRINASNPCSEFMYLDDTACNLSSLNLMRFRTETGEFDTVSFARASETMITAMEILVGFSSYPTPAIEQNSFDHRPLGIGYANLGALLMARGLAYDSDEGRNYAAAITALLSGTAYAQSARIASKIGPFTAFLENREPMMGVMAMHRDAAYHIKAHGVAEDLLEAAHKSWDAVVELGWKHGLRNSQISVLAPTGTIAFLMDCDTTGIEPDIALVKYKWLVGGGMLKLVNGTVPEALARLGYNGNQIDDILAHINDHDTIEGAPHLKTEHLSVFDCAFKPSNGTRAIPYMAHIFMMAAVQPFISGAISKTVNMPHESTADEIANVYREGWKLGLKAIAIYRDGSKRQQPLTTSLDKDQSKQQKKVEAPSVPVPRRRRLPDERRAITHKFSVGGHEGYLTVGLYDDGQPGEMFITMAKEGSVISGLMDSFATAVSISFQYGVPLKTLVNKFVHMRFEPSGFTGHPSIKMAKSIVDYVFRWLALKFLPVEDQLAVGVNIPAPIAEDGVHVIEVAPVVSTPQSTLFESKAAIPVAEKSANALAGLIETFNNTADAPVCDTCGAIMVRNAACYKCLNCGSTSGCS